MGKSNFILISKTFQISPLFTFILKGIDFAFFNIKASRIRLSILFTFMWKFICQYLIHLLNLSRELLHQCSVNLLILSVLLFFIVMAWIGGLKVCQYEADGIAHFVSNSPFFSYMYEKGQI